MKPTRRTQPYRKKKARPAGATLEAILRGEPALRPHPLSSQRRLRKSRGAGRSYLVGAKGSANATVPPGSLTISPQVKQQTKRRKRKESALGHLHR